MKEQVTKILVAAGGTGGHIYPGIAISDELLKTIPGAEITFVGSYVGMEKDIVPKAGYNIEYIRARGFERGFSKETLEAVRGIFQSRKDAKELLDRYEPDLVIGTGGFTSAMLLREAARRGIPTMIHEQNAYPGRSNRLLGRHVDRIAISFPEAAEYFKRDKLFLSGNPIRDAFKSVDRKKAREKFGLSHEDFMILIMGGSQGAESINKAVVELMKTLTDENVKYFHLTGKEQYETIREALEPLRDTITLFGYSDDVANLLSAADLVISRSGASSVAEIAACGTPSILIPYPMAAGDHQTYNARVLSEHSAGVLIPESELNEEKLLKTVLSILNNPVRQQQMRKHALDQSILDAAERFASEAKELVETTKE